MDYKKRTKLYQKIFN